jgi:hypothetical protein
MKIRIASLIVIAFAFGLAVLAATGTAQARVQTIYHGGTYFGDVMVEPGQVVDGDLNVVFGDAIIEGTVNGDVNVVGGSAQERGGGTITGQVHSVGGDVTRSIVPWAPNDAVRDAVNQDYRIMWRIAWDVVVLLVFLIFPLRTRMALDRLEQHPGLSIAAGLLGWVAVIPVAILLAVTILLIPLIPVEAVALVAGVFIGKAALSLLVGRRLYELLQPKTTPSPITALILGLVLLTAAELVPVIGALVTVLVGLVGLGAVILSLVNEQSFRSGPPVPGMTTRPPVGGPPMPVA